MLIGSAPDDVISVSPLVVCFTDPNLMDGGPQGYREPNLRTTALNDVFREAT